MSELLRAWLWAGVSCCKRGGSPLAAGEAGCSCWRIAVYCSPALWRLADFPIYFFTDEAIQTVWPPKLAA